MTTMVTMVVCGARLFCSVIFYILTMRRKSGEGNFESWGYGCNKIRWSVQGFLFGAEARI